MSQDRGGHLRDDSAWAVWGRAGAGAKLLGEVGDVRRFPTKHLFASHTGTAPLAASGGRVVRQRLSRAGDRKLNHALHLMRSRRFVIPPPARATRRKGAEGKSATEALRCLKRRLSDAVYRNLLADLQRPRVASG